MKAVIKEVQECYGFMWFQMREGVLPFERKKWMGSMTAARTDLDELSKTIETMLLFD